MTIKIAVVGGGIFGITTAFKLAQHFPVTLFEKNDDLFKSASGINQYRVHRGYHYPRSRETVVSLLKAESSFRNEFSNAIMNDNEHYYCIAKKNSLTSTHDYLAFCNRNNLEYKRSTLKIINQNSIDLCIKVKESLFDPIKLKDICWKKLKMNNVKILLNTKATNKTLERYDFNVICTYARINELLQNFPHAQLKYQFELCEKPLVDLPQSFNKRSIVIMDGPFMSIDPFGNSGFFVLGNVVHAIHKTHIGTYPQFDEKFLSLIDNGIIKKPPITNFELFIESASEFIPEIKKAKHVGSMFTIRAVLPGVEETDERPTIVRQINNQTITVFSGKIPTCVDAAEEVVQLATKLNQT